MTIYYVLECFKGDYMLSVQPIDSEKLEEYMKECITINTEEDLNKADVRWLNNYIYSDKLLAAKAEIISNKLFLDEVKSEISIKEVTLALFQAERAEEAKQ